MKKCEAHAQAIQKENILILMFSLQILLNTNFLRNPCVQILYSEYCHQLFLF